MQLSLFGPDGQSGRTSLEPSAAIKGTTSLPSLIRWQKQGRWSSSGLCWTRNTSECPSDDGACSSSLALILQPPTDVPTRYYLSQNACQGILRRSERRGKQLPEALRSALEQTAA